MIELFEHNKTTNDSAVSIIPDTGRAAIIRPAETGKSIIGLRLCKNHPGRTVCWLSPQNMYSKHNLRTWQRYQTAMSPKMSGSLSMPS